MGLNFFFLAMSVAFSKEKGSLAMSLLIAIGFPLIFVLLLTYYYVPLLTPKFGKESDLWVRLDEESVWWKE
jgi:hypothetical protein